MSSSKTPSKPLKTKQFISLIFIVILILFLGEFFPQIFNTNILAFVLLVPIILTASWVNPITPIVALSLAIYLFTHGYYINSLMWNQPHVYLFLAVSFLAYIINKNGSKKTGTTKEDKCETLLDNAIESICVIQDNKIQKCNKAFIQMTGFSREELLKISFYELVPPADRKKQTILCNPNPKQENKHYRNVFSMVKKDKSVIQVKASITQVNWDSNPAVMISMTDVTESRKIEAEIRNSDKNNSLLLAQMQSGLLFCELLKNKQGVEDDCVILKTNKGLKEILGIDGYASLEGNSFKKTLPELNGLFERMKNVAKGGSKVQSEFFLKKLNKYVEYFAFSTDSNQFAVFFNDITTRKNMEKKVKFLNTHDNVTGLYNERYLEQELQKYNSIDSGQVSIIVAQLNGIKLANSAFRHLSWKDSVLKFTEILKKECREIDIITKEGRDKFVVVLPGANKADTDKIVQNIKTSVNKETEKNAIFSAAIGYETKEDIADDINDVYEQAKNNMYKDKLLMSDDVRDGNIQTIINALYGINDLEQGHANNVSIISEKIATALGFTKYETEQIKTAALLHDVGNISIDPVILTKQEKYTEEEWEILKKHPEAGYRILSTSGIYKHIAKYVLEHHERWDGEGYPKKLKGEEISLPARIIAIADSFDAMTTNKPYKKSYTLEEAITEIKANAGKQFDPDVVKVFTEKIAPEYKK